MTDVPKKCLTFRFFFSMVVLFSEPFFLKRTHFSIWFSNEQSITAVKMTNKNCVYQRAL